MIFSSTLKQSCDFLRYGNNKKKKTTPTVLESTWNFILNWSHRKVMGSKLPSSVWKAPKHRKSTCQPKSPISCQVQRSQWDHNLSYTGHLRALTTAVQWFPIGPTVPIIDMHRKGKLFHSAQEPHDNRQLLILVLSVLPLFPSPGDPSVVRNIYIYW